MFSENLTRKGGRDTPNISQVKKKSAKPLGRELELYRENGVSLYLDGAPSTPKKIAKACQIAENGVYMGDYTDDEATIIMVDSNIQREDILPSEKARAYAMKYEAMKHQGKKGAGNSLDEVGEAAGESGKTVQRYIYLSRLSDELLELVDKRKIGLVQGVDLSFLNEQEQEWVQAVIEETGVFVSTSQSSKLKEYGKNNELTLPMVRLILTESKQKERKVIIKADKISRYFPEEYSSEEIEKVIYQLLEEWSLSESRK